MSELLLGLVAPLGLDVPADVDAILAAYGAAGWRFRRLTLAVPAPVAEALAVQGVLGAADWSAVELVRVAMLARALAQMADAPAVVERIFRTGDNGEREAMLKGLMALPGPERFLPTALDACRAAVLTTFAAIATANAYPARHFPDEGFRAMVVKALHLGVPLAGIHGLDARADAELARMAADYADERRAAGRSVPADVSLLSAFGGAS